jgi:hypothetical protein
MIPATFRALVVVSASMLSLTLAPASQAQDADRPDANVYIDFSREFIDAAVAQSAASIDPVCDYILGTSIRGTGQTQARTSVVFIRSDGDATIDLVTRGTTYTNTVGYNGKVQLYNNATIPFEIRRRVWLSPDGLWAGRSSASAQSHSQLNGISTSYGFLINRIATKIANKKYNQSHGQADAIASSHAASRLSQRGDQDSQNKLGDAAQYFQDKLAEVKKKKIPLQNLRFGTMEHALYMRSRLASATEAVAVSKVPSLKNWCYASVRIHETAINHTMAETVAGKTYNDEQLEKEIGSILGPLGGKKKPKAPDEEKEWTITFAKGKPVETTFADQGAKVKIRLAEFTSGDNEYSGMDVSAAYKFEKRGDQLVAIRQGNIEAFPPDFKQGQKLAGRQQVMRTILQKRFGRLFEKEVVLEQMNLSGDLAKAGPLTPGAVESDRGWFLLTMDKAQ